MRSWKLTLLIGLGALLAVGDLRAEFRVADLIYVPVVAHNEGANDSLWRSDVIITNMEAEDSIDVAMIFLPSGLHSNAFVFSNRELFAGGRESDGFGVLDEQLADIPPGGSILIEDIVGQYWPEQAGLNGQGALIVFSYLSGSLQEDGSREYRNMMISSRTYNVTTVYTPDPENEGEFLEETGTYGQTMPGVPWYDLADGGFKDDTRDFTFLWVDGAQESEAYRYNLGIVNTSDVQTTIMVKIEPFQPSGEPFVAQNDEGEDIPLSLSIQIPPLAHIQYYQILGTVFGLTDVPQARIKVSMEAWRSTGSDPSPTFTIYGSLIDNISNDPTTFTPSFGQPYDIECTWPTPVDDGEEKNGTESAKRPVEIPGK